ncbi:F-box/FBD/LRR-repeat protein At1g13570 [Musa acuminata AAA Group]|uniref:F-box/FBD/LRR-repeat protein At1g13570 n=1 Tax=Musa acuminata AAA Group TaxID=214697 RepID=UPI0031E33C23
MEMVAGLPESIVQSFHSIIQLSATALDFGSEFASNKTPEEFVAVVNRILQLHGGNKLERLRLYFCPLDLFLPDINNWIAFSIAKGVEALEMNFSMGFDLAPNQFSNGARFFRLPDHLYPCNSLTHLSLSHCEIQPPLGFTGFSGLRFLSLADVDITNDVLQFILANCPNLESLILREWLSLESIELVAENPRLRRLAFVECWNTYQIEISATHLQSFIFYGEYAFGSEFNLSESSNVIVPSLEDAFISSIGMEHTQPYHDYTMLLSDIAQVKILTVCSETLMFLIDHIQQRFTIYEETDAALLLLVLPNLQELQLLMDSMNSEYLKYIYGYLRLCHTPLLEKLFIQLPSIPEDLTYIYDPSE